MVHQAHLWLIFFKTIIFIISTHAVERSGSYEETPDSFIGLSQDVRDVSSIRCAARCLLSTCRGIYLDANHVCKNLYETNDVSESDRNRYNQVSLSSNEDTLLINVLHRCSSESPCRHGVCEAFEWIYQCVCVDTGYYGPLCETAGDPWIAPNGWDTLHPQLNLNLDDQNPYVLHNGSMHVSTENGYGFEIAGNPQYVDLGNWTGQTCFVDVYSCEEGFTLLAYVNIVTAGNMHFRGYISSVNEESGGYNGAAIMGHEGEIYFGFYGETRYLVLGVVPAAYPTGWIRLMAVYTKNVGADLYIDSVLKGQDHVAKSTTTTTERSEHIVLGKFADGIGWSGELTVDWLTIWDRPLSEEERNLVHQD